MDISKSCRLIFSGVITDYASSRPDKVCGEWWLIGRLGAFRPKGRQLESPISRHVGTLSKSFTRSCLQGRIKPSGGPCQIYMGGPLSPSHPIPLLHFRN